MQTGSLHLGFSLIRWSLGPAGPVSGLTVVAISGKADLK